MGVRDDGKPDRRHIERKTEGEVIDAIRKLERERDSGKVRKTGQAWTVEKWLLHWLENIAAPTIRPNTYSGYHVAVHNHLIPGIGAHRITKLTAEHLERFYVALGQKRTKSGELFKPARVHQVHRVIRTALGEAMRRNHITSNPASVARPPRIPDEEIIPFTREEAAKILKAAENSRNGARFVLALTLGLRKGEALGLQWRDVDFERKTLTIRRTVQRLNWNHGCPAKKPCGHKYAGHCPQRYGGGMVTAEVKSRAGKRVMGLPDPVIAVLKEHRGKQNTEKWKAGNLWREEGWVFTNQLGGPTHIRVDHDTWKALLKRAGVRDARLHDARHTAATMLLVLGVPQRAVMDVMGWSEASMAGRYQHVTSEITAAIADKVGGLYWSSTPDEDEEDDDGSAGVLAAV
jgi:integrase